MRYAPDANPDASVFSTYVRRGGGNIEIESSTSVFLQTFA